MCESEAICLFVGCFSSDIAQWQRSSYKADINIIISSRNYLSSPWYNWDKSSLGVKQQSLTHPLVWLDQNSTCVLSVYKQKFLLDDCVIFKYKFLHVCLSLFLYYINDITIGLISTLRLSAHDTRTSWSRTKDSTCKCNIEK